MKRQEIEGTIEHLDKDGRGIVKTDTRDYAIFNTAPGDTVKAETRRRCRGVTEAELIEIIKSGPGRTEPKCPYAAKCGGCKWQHLDYQTQLKAKRNAINRTFSETGLTYGVQEVTPAPEIFYYRNRMDYSFGPNGQLGLKQPGHWWEPLDLEVCYLESEEAVEILKRIREWAREQELSFWDNRQHEGLLRYVVIREGKNTDERMVTILASESADKKVTDALRAKLDDLATSIVWGINTAISVTSIAEEVLAIKGDPWIHESINGYQYRIHPNSFFQTNSRMAAVLQDTVREFCGELKDKTLLDLYCGSGFFSIALASDTKQAIGIELDPFGIESAKLNAGLNQIANVEYHVAKAEDFDWIGIMPEVVIVDPPRAGLHPKVLETLRLALPERIVYVSCNYNRFAEELPFLLTHYKITKQRALDLFPHTPHVELITLFEHI